MGYTCLPTLADSLTRYRNLGRTHRYQKHRQCPKPWVEQWYRPATCGRCGIPWCINLFTAPACSISGLKSTHTRLKTVFSGPITNLISIVWILMEIYSHANAKKQKQKHNNKQTKPQERLKHFKFPTFIGCFQVTSWQ